MSATFEDILAAGHVDEKIIYVRGLEIKVKPLTIAEALELGEIQKRAEGGKGKQIDAILYAIKKAVVSPAMDDAKLEKLQACNSAFIQELSEAIGKEINPSAGQAEKN